MRKRGVYGVWHDVFTILTEIVWENVIFFAYFQWTTIMLQMPQTTIITIGDTISRAQIKSERKYKTQKWSGMINDNNLHDTFIYFFICPTQKLELKNLSFVWDIRPSFTSLLWFSKIKNNQTNHNTFLITPTKEAILYKCSYLLCYYHFASTRF